MNRRELLRILGVGAASGAGAQLPAVHRAVFPLGESRRGAAQAFVPDVELELTAAPGEATILPGAPTSVWRFTGSVVKGPAGCLQELPGSYLGPVIRLREGQRVRIRFHNRLPESSIVHWHGLDVPSAMDGHPHRAIDTGGTYVYEFQVTNRAGTYWYHPHPHERTGAQVYRGLAGVLVVTDEEEAAAQLPRGADEFVCVLQDRRFDERNQFVYPGDMMTQRHGFTGNQVLVNGQAQRALLLGTRAYRLRLLNGSSSRVYKLVWSDGTPMTVVGSDGGLLERAVERPALTLGPAQRADVIIDLSGRAVGSSLELRSAPFLVSDVTIDEGGMMRGAGRRGMNAMGELPQGAPLTLMALNVARREQSTFRMPERLSRFDASWGDSAPGSVRRIEFTFRAGQWLLGGRTFEMMDTLAEDIVRANTSQIWELANIGGMMNTPFAHPFHMHGRQFRVLSRTRPVGAAPTSLGEGILDGGWQDTVLVLPHEIVRLHVHFTTHPGLYLYHCHILEHEDLGMMRNFRIVSG